MLDLEQDLTTVFFGADFASTFTRQRPGVGDVQFEAIFGAGSADALESRVVVATRALRYAAGVDVRADDTVVTVVAIAPDVPAGTVFRVMEPPRRSTDGLEEEALLGSVLA